MSLVCKVGRREMGKKASVLTAGNVTKVSPTASYYTYYIYYTGARVYGLVAVTLTVNGLTPYIFA